MFWLWLLLYGLLFAVPRALAPAAAPLLTPALLAVYWAVLLFAALNIAFGGARPGIAEAVYLLFAVFGEEVLFRGVLPAVWGEKLGAAGAAAASAALFALLHLGSAIGGSVSAAAVQALCAFGAGLLLTAVRARTGSIALPLLAHALINLTGSGAVYRDHRRRHVYAQVVDFEAALRAQRRQKGRYRRKEDPAGHFFG